MIIDKFILSIMLLLGWLHAVLANTYDVQWKKGNEYFAAKQYDSAAAYFERIAAAKPDNATVYYNLGNTYYRLNKIAPAVLNYERALHIAPDYKDAKDNLSLTQSRIPNRIQGVPDVFFVRWWHTAVNEGTATTWAIASLIIFLAVVAIASAKRLGKLKQVPAQVNVVLVLLLIVMFACAFSAAQTAADSGKAVVMQQDEPLISEPQKGKLQSLVPEGTTVEVIRMQAEWAEVKLPDSRTGWINRSAITSI